MEDEEGESKDQNDQPESDWKFNPSEAVGDNQSEKSTSGNTADQFAWVETKFIAHDKSPLWYVGLFLAAVILALLVYFVMKDVISTAVIIIVAIIFGIVAGRKPQNVDYMVDNGGISVNRTYRAFADFKSFVTIDEGKLTEMIFIPMKRFSPPLSIYYGQNEESTVLQLVSDHLPLDQSHGNDAVDRFIRKIKF